jgi:hypothetical protein
VLARQLLIEALDTDIALHVEIWKVGKHCSFDKCYLGNKGDLTSTRSFLLSLAGNVIGH